MALGAVSGRADVPRSGDLEGGDAGKKIPRVETVTRMGYLATISVKPAGNAELPKTSREFLRRSPRSNKEAASCTCRELGVGLCVSACIFYPMNPTYGWLGCLFLEREGEVE